MSFQRQFSAVLSQSKKIKKVAACSPVSPNKKKYKTFDSNTRQDILSTLKETLISKNLVDQEENNLSSSDLLQLLEKADLDDFNNILCDTLKKHIASFRASVFSLRRWRRKIKEWITSSEKPETRGHGLIPHDKLNQFKQLLIPEIEKMTTRSLVLVKKKVFKVFRNIEHPVPPKSCSKHWWYTFLDKNTDVREVWESLPKRSCGKDAQCYDSAGSDSESQTREDTSFEEGVVEINIEDDLSPFLLDNVREEDYPIMDEIEEESPEETGLDYNFNPFTFDDVREDEELECRETEDSRDQWITFNMDCLRDPSLQDREDHGTKKEGIVKFLEDALRMEPRDSISFFLDEN